MGNDKFNLIYKSDDLGKLENLAISPYLNIKQIHEMWGHYHHGLHIQDEIRKYIKCTKTLPDAQVINLIETGITEIQDLVEERLNLSNIILTEEIIKAIINTEMPINSALETKIFKTPKLKATYLQLML